MEVKPLPKWKPCGSIQGLSGGLGGRNDHFMDSGPLGISGFYFQINAMIYTDFPGFGDKLCNSVTLNTCVKTKQECK